MTLAEMAAKRHGSGALMLRSSWWASDQTGYFRLKLFAISRNACDGWVRRGLLRARFAARS